MFANSTRPITETSTLGESKALSTDLPSIHRCDGQLDTRQTLKFGSSSSALGDRAVSFLNRLTGWGRQPNTVSAEAPDQALSTSPQADISMISDSLTTSIAPSFTKLELPSDLSLQSLQMFPATVSNFVLAMPTVQIESGTLGADTFTYIPGYDYTVFSGNGNVSFGQGGRDLIDLSNISSSSASLNLASATSGVLFNPGNGTRVFDSLTLSNGSKILFEGIDAIRFADRTINLAITPNDPGFQQQWNLHMMGVQDAWRFTTGSTSVMIGVEDTGLGVDVTGRIHPDLRANSFYGNNYKDDYLDLTISHGTSVTSIIAAASDNGIGMSGINWRSQMLDVDVFGSDKNYWTWATASQTMINTANQAGKDLVINMSLGIPNSLGQTGLNLEFERVIASNPNTLFVIASGNENVNGISYPSALAKLYSNVIAVGASWGDQDKNGSPKAPGTRISYPGNGGWGSNYGNGLTLMGPSEVLATTADLTNAGVQFGYDNKFNGTSAATPNVTGVASLVWSVNPNLTAAQVKFVLSQTAYDLGSKGYDIAYGNGFVNADAAVRRAIAIGAGAI